MSSRKSLVVPRNPMMRLKLAHKLLISSATFILPIAVLLAFMVSGFSDIIDTARVEKDGVVVLNPLVRLLTLVPSHGRSTVASLSGQPTGSGAPAAIAADASHAFEDLVRTMGGLAPDAGGNAGTDAAALASDWRALVSGWQGMTPEDCAAAHQRIVDRLRILLETICHRTGLIHDPDLDSHLLMETALRQMPDGLLRVHALMGDILATGSPGGDTTAMRIRLAMMADELSTRHIKVVQTTVRDAIASDSSYYGISPTLQSELPGVMLTYAHQATGFTDALAHLGSTTELRSALATATDAGTAALAAGAALEATALHQLSILLDMRIAHYRSSRLVALLASLIALLTACALVFTIGRGVTRPLGRVTSIATHIAHGDIRRAAMELDAATHDGDALAHLSELEGMPSETARLFHAVTLMTQTLHTLIKQVQHSTRLVLESTDSIAASAVGLEATVVQQAASSNEVSATTREIATTAHGLADTMARVTQMGGEAAGHATTGTQSLAEIRVVVQSLIEAIDTMRDKLGIISRRASAIGDVLVAITKVSNQTNLLSLNAAIEAEKAGEYGAGFSIVAREIRRLADQTSIAALDIETMINEMQVAVGDGVQGVTNYARQVHAGSETIAAISADLEQIIRHITELGPEFATVNHGTQMQSHSANQITEAIDQLRVSTNHTKDSLLGFRTITAQLRDAVQGLQREITRFTIINDGDVLRDTESGQ